MRQYLVMMAAGFALLAGCATPSPSVSDAADSEVGVVVMAHGGSADWNRDVRDMLAPVAEEVPLEVAFGMADAASLQAAIERLEERAVHRIAVVRLFVSGESWYERTEQILGLAPGAPARPAEAHADRDAHDGHRMEFWRVDTDAAFALSTEGLSEAPEMGGVIAARAQALSTDPPAESVLILAHGPGDDAENRRWIENIDALADAVRAAAPFRRVAVQTLREDWPEKRAAASARVRHFVDAAADDGRAIVIPFRVSGFGPYAEVLDGLTYAADGQGLLPSAGAERWVRRQIGELLAADFRAPLLAQDTARPTAHHGTYH